MLNAFFTNHFERVQKSSKEIEILPEHHNGTGYLDGLAEADLGLEAGEMRWGHDKPGRRIIVQGTPLGNVVIFERYLEPDSRYITIITMMSDELRRISHIRRGDIDEDQLDFLVGKPAWSDGIGVEIANLLKSKAARQYIATLEG